MENEIDLRKCRKIIKDEKLLCNTRYHKGNIESGVMLVDAVDMLEHIILEMRLETNKEVHEKHVKHLKSFIEVVENKDFSKNMVINWKSPYSIRIWR